MMVLASLEQLHIRALFSKMSSAVSLRRVALEVASEAGGGPPASNVELCMCPANYLGDSCQVRRRGQHQASGLPPSGQQCPSLPSTRLCLTLPIPASPPLPPAEPAAGSRACQCTVSPSPCAALYPFTAQSSPCPPVQSDPVSPSLTCCAHAHSLPGLPCDAGPAPPRWPRPSPSASPCPGLTGDAGPAPSPPPGLCPRLLPGRQRALFGSLRPLSVSRPLRPLSPWLGRLRGEWDPM